MGGREEGASREQHKEEANDGKTWMKEPETQVEGETADNNQVLNVPHRAREAFVRILRSSFPLAFLGADGRKQAKTVMGPMKKEK